MKKLFVHHPIFRLLSPLFSGTLVYMLILLINNNIQQLQETFLGQELYVCIGLAYLIQEFARVSLLFFKKVKWPYDFIAKAVLQILVSIAMTVLLVSMTMFLYFHYFLSYTPNFTELSIFNTIFSFITVIYVTLYFSHHFLYKINTHKIEKETRAKERVKEDFMEFKKGMNSELLFETLEALLVIMKKGPDQAEEMTENFSSVYRYVLSKKNRELVPVADEISVLVELVALFDRLPYRKITLEKVETGENWLPPTTLLTIVEQIVRTTIASEQQSIKIHIVETEQDLSISYRPEEKLNNGFSEERLGDIKNRYAYYSSKTVRIENKNTNKTIYLPKLRYHESSHT